MNIALIAFFSAFLTGFNPDCQTVTAGLDINTSNTTVLNQCAFYNQYFYKSNSIDFDAGVRFANKEIDLNSGFSIYPFQFRKWKIGLLGRVHFRNEGDLYKQVDVFGGFDFVITPLKWMEIETQVAYYLCCSEIIPLRQYGTQWYYNNSHYFSLDINFIPVNWLKLSLCAESSEYFYYRLFGSASFSCGADIYLPAGIILGARLSSRWIDLITLAGNYDGTDFKIYAGYRWL